MSKKYKDNIAEENGKFFIKVKVHGRQKQLLVQGATCRADAQAVLDAEKFKMRQVEAGLVKEEKKVQLSTLIKLYDNDAKINKKSYGKNPFGKYIGEFFGTNTIVTSISVQKIENFKVYLREKRQSSNSTINKYLFALSKMYRLGIKNKLISENPVKEICKFKEDNHRIRYLTKEEETRMFEAIDELFPYLRPIVTCALKTGMRRGEIFNLKWENIDYDFRFIEVLESKSGNSRKIPLSSKLEVVLNSIKNNSEYVFINKDTGKPFNDIKKAFHKVLEKAKIEKFRFHDLRHTVATRMVASGVPLPVVQEILGHKKISTTMQYTHVIPNQKTSAIEILDNY